MKRRNWNHFIAAAMFTGLCGIISTLGVSRFLAHQASKEIRNAEIETFIHAVEAGAGGFAQMHSARFSQDQLEELIRKSPRIQDMLFAVRVLGHFSGEAYPRVYAAWTRPNSGRAQAPTSTRVVPIGSGHSVATWSVELTENDHFLPAPMATLVRSNSVVIGITYFLLCTILVALVLPIIRGIRDIESVLASPEDRVERDILDRVSFEPLYQLAQKAMTSSDLRKEAALGRQAEQVAHDLQSPIAALQVAFDIGISEKSIQDLGQQAIQRVQAIVRDLQPRNGGTHGARPTPSVEFSRVVEQIIAEKRVTKLGKLLRWNVDVAQGVYVKGDEYEWGRAVSNILQNALEACESDGVIDLRLATDSNVVSLKITDSGKGMSPDQLLALGQRGITFGKTSLNGAGTGLGVFQAKNAIEAAGGKIRFESNVGTGTGVYIEGCPDNPAPV